MFLLTNDFSWKLSFYINNILTHLRRQREPKTVLNSHIRAPIHELTRLWNSYLGFIASRKKNMAGSCRRSSFLLPFPSSSLPRERLGGKSPRNSLRYRCIRNDCTGIAVAGMYMRGARVHERICERLYVCFASRRISNLFVAPNFPWVRTAWISTYD